MRAPPGMHDTTGGVVDEKPALAFNCSASPPSAIAPFERAPATVAIPLTADIRLRCNICRNGPIVFSNSGSGCQALSRSSLPGPLFSPR